MRIKKPNVPSGQDNSPGDKPTMRDAITRILREAKDSLAEHPILSVVVLLIMALLSAVELLDSVALEHPTAYSRPLLVIDQIDDLIAVGVALFVAYRWRPRLGQLAAIFYLALHVPYVFFDLPDETYEMARQGFMGFTTLLGVWLIDKLRKTQIILETAEQTFRTTVNSTPAGVCIAQDGKLSYVNPQFAGHTGYSEEELIGADFLELVAADDRRLVRNNAREAVQKGLPSSCEHRFVTKGGETRWVLQTAAPITYNGKTALIGSFVDITRRRQAEADVRRQEQRREALYRVSQAVTRSLALRDVANLALDAAIDILRVDAGIIRCFDEAEQRLVLLAHRGLPAEAVQDIEAKPGPKSSHGASGLILESETLVVIEDITARPDLFYGPVRRAGFVTFAGFPLKVNDRAIGTMSAFFTSRRSFAPDDVEMLSSLGNIIGVAVANAQLFEGQRLRNQELAALQRVSQAVAASLDLEKVAGQALAEGLAILNLDGGFIRYVDEAREETVMLATLGIPSEISKEVGVVLGRRKLTEGLVGQVVQTGLPMIVDDYARRSRHPFLARAGFQCAMFLPLKVGNKVVGTLTGFSAQPRSFSAADTDMMTSIGNMVGMAIDNARFLAKMKDRSEKRAAMNSITAAIASSLHIDEIYAVIAREISHVIPYDRLTVGILTPEKDAISILQIGQAQQMPQRQSLEDTPLGEVAKTGEPCIYRDLELEASVYPVVKHLVEAGFHSGLVAPLSAEGNVLGTLNIVSLEVGRYSQADLEYVQPIAHQLAVALSHARLFGQVEAAAKEWGLTFDAIGDGVMILSPDLRILQANSAMGRLTGTSPDAIVGQHCFRVVHGLMEPTPECPSVRCKELRQPCELVIQDPHPGNRWFNVRCEPMLAPDGRLTGIVHTLQDITARKQAEDDLRKAHNELEERIRERTAELTNVNEVLHAEIVEHERADRSIRMSHRLLEIANLHTEIAPLLKDFAAEIRGFTGYAGVGVCVVDAGGNPLYEAYDGFTREFFEVESAACVRSKRCKCVSVVEGTVDKSSALYTEGGSFCINSIARFMREASGQESGQAFEVCRRHGYESMALVPVLISDHARGFIQVADPRENALPGDLVQTLEKAGLQLGIAIRRVMAESSAATDHLTGLFNHRHFVDRLEQEVASAHRQCGAFSLAMIDIDGFKKVNDMLGHMAGDRVLREVAGTIRGCIRGYDVAFRYGGDEFAIILPDAGYDGAATTVDRIRKAIGEVTPAGIGVPEVKLGLSGGVACFPNDSTNSQELIMMADTALYRAKQRGGNGTCRAAEPEASPVPDRNWETFRMNSVYALAAAVDAKDHHTFGHSGRVAALCTSLGYRLGMSTPLVERLSSAALLHDIGKLSVPDKVLRKREDLTEQEWEEVRRHPEHGIRIIEKIPQLTPIVPAILHHHERFDGLGYPSGLKGEDIPLKARVIAIVDAYDTMTSARSYRGVLSTEEALAELRRCAGTQFDPELVEAFAAMIIEGQVKGLSVSPER